MTRLSGYHAILSNMKGFTLVKYHSSVLSASVSSGAKQNDLLHFGHYICSCLVGTLREKSKKQFLQLEYMSESNSCNY